MGAIDVHPARYPRRQRPGFARTTSPNREATAQTIMRVAMGTAVPRRNRGHARLRLRDRGRPAANFARFTVLDLDAAHDFYPDWDGAADICVAILRTEAGRDPHDGDLHDLVGELATRSKEFRRRWSAHDAWSTVPLRAHLHHQSTLQFLSTANIAGGPTRRTQRVGRG
jgi:hypothetical protein